MTNSPSWSEYVKPALNAMTGAPKKLAALVSTLGEVSVQAEEILAHLEQADPNDQGLVALRIALSRWDAEEPAEWSRIESFLPEAYSVERRGRAVALLGFEEKYEQRIRELVPIKVSGSVIIAKDFDPWYQDARHLRSTLYWDHYLAYLQTQKQWPADSLSALDQATSQIVERLSDPRREEARQTKGLVVGYVQSGKTANFTGVLAKAIDAGYRLVIVLTGTIEVLRAQTQLRLDKELVGRENILDGLDERDPEVVKGLDYQQGEDWLEDRFVRHGDLELQGAPHVRRLTTHKSDYKKLPHGQTQLRFPLFEAGKPLNHEANLDKSAAYVAVVKKNPAALRKLLADIEPFKRKGELPVLIIDDESDQASVDTTDPKKYGSESPDKRKRTTINKLIVDLLTKLPRAQYIGYTATPFANVFIDPDEDENIFPSHFILSLERTPGYMGVADFHDVGVTFDDETPTVKNCNELAYVRALVADPTLDPKGRLAELGEALDAFVLAGAIKKYRQAQTGTRYRHHTMLVHESVRQVEHAEAATDVRSLWAATSYTAPEGLARLRTLWEGDFAPVSAARADGELVPGGFEDLIAHVGEVVAALGKDPVSVMNSDKEVAAAQKSVDFESTDVWRILVGGTQLSRGFTVEGLTVSYFRRRSMQADTLMQAGRWFGFRPGYQDLVRLYIRRDDRVDLYKAFEALMLDEEAFREELRQYAVIKDDGRPAVEPWQVPPLVSQHLPWLKPTARNKMWNARIEEKGSGGRAVDLYQLPPRISSDREWNLKNIAAPILGEMDTEVSLAFDLGGGEKGQVLAKIGRLDTAELLAYLRPHGGHRWQDEFQPVWGPTYRFLEKMSASSQITGWHVLWPQLLPSAREESPVLPGAAISIPARKRRLGRHDFSGSDRKHRDVAERLAGTPASTLADPVRDALRDGSTSTGVVLAYLARDVTAATGDDGTVLDRPSGDDWHDLVLLLSIVVPPDAANDHSNRIRWVVQRKELTGVAAVRPLTLAEAAEAALGLGEIDRLALIHESLSAAEASEILGRSSVEIAGSVGRGELFGWPDASGNVRLLAGQFRNGAALPVLATLLETLGEMTAEERCIWLLSPHPDLDDQRPLDVLAEGHTERVHLAALRATRLSQT
jgi:hypothetical protein